MAIVAEMKRDLLLCQAELAELSEFTTLEKQFEMAQNELSKQLEVLQEENRYLRKITESSSSLLHSETIIGSAFCRESSGTFEEMYKKDINSTLKVCCINDEKSLKKLDSNKMIQNFDENIQDINCEEMPKSDITGIDSMNSSITNDSLNANILALSDECHKDEIIQLENEIGELKGSIELKDKHISLLKDKIQIKEQMILSLKDEIALDHNTNSVLDSTCKICKGSKVIEVLNMTDQPTQTTPIKLKEHSTQYFNDDVGIKQQNVFTSPIKESHYSLLISGDDEDLQSIHNLEQFSGDFSISCKYSSRTSLNNKPLIIPSTSTKLLVEQSSETYMIGESIDGDLNIRSDMGSNCDNVNKINKDQLTQTTPIKLKEFSTQYCNIDNNMKQQYVQTSPIKQCEQFSKYPSFKDGKNKECVEDLEKYSEISYTENQFVEASRIIEGVEGSQSISNALSDQTIHMSDPELATRSDIDSRSSIKKLIPNALLKQGLSPFTENCVNDKVNHISELEVLADKLNQLKIYAFNFMKNYVKSEYMEGVDISMSQSVNLSAEKELVTLESLLRILESHIKNTNETFEIFNNELDSKFNQAASLDAKLSEAQLNLNEKESKLTALSEKIADLKQNLSQLTFMCDMLKGIESENELNELRKLSNISNIAPYSIPLYDLKIIKDMIIKVDSSMEEYVLKFIEMSEKLKTTEKAMLELKQNFETLSAQYSSGVRNSSCSQSVQTEAFAEMAELITLEKDNLVLQLQEEVKQLKDQNVELERRRNNVHMMVNRLQASHSAKVYALETRYESVESEWSRKTQKLIKDLEAKYEQDMKDLENEFDDNIAKIKALHDKELQNVQNQIKKLEDQLYAETVEKDDLKCQLAKEKEQEISLRRKHEEVVNIYKGRQMQCRDINSQLKFQINYYQDKIGKLKQEAAANKNEAFVQQLKEKITELTNENETLCKKYDLANQYISELENDKEKMNDQKETERNFHSNRLKEIDETNKNLIFELDQKKAKIMSLESNNSSLVHEVKKLKDMLLVKSHLTCPKCKINLRSSKSNLPSGYEDGSVNLIKNKLELHQRSDPDGMAKTPSNRKGSTENEEMKNNSDKENMKQENELLIGGGSGPANMVKCYWLEGIIHKKDKEIAKLKKEVNELQKPAKIHRLNSEEKKPAPILYPWEMDQNCTAWSFATHPYPDGVIPEVQVKQILKEKNDGACEQTNKVHHRKTQIRSSVMESTHSKEKPKKVEDFARILSSGEPECKQQ